MQLQWNMIAAVNGLNTLVCLFVVWLSWRRRTLTGARRMLVMMGSIATWVGFATLESASVRLEDKLLWASIEYLGISFTPLAYMWLSMEFDASHPPWRHRTMALLLAPPLVITAVAFTNPWHHLLWSGFRTAPRGQIAYEHGPAYFGVLAYNYGLFLAASARMLRAIFHFPRHYWKLGLLLTIALATPFAASVTYSMGWAPPGIDPTPIGLSLTGLALGLALLRTRLLDLAPIARELLVERMHEGILVFDARHRLVDFNPSAQRIVGSPLSIGSAASELPAPWNGLEDRIVPDRLDPLEFGPFSDDLWFEARIGPLQGIGTTGHAVILHDISLRKSMERRLLDMASHDALTGLSNRHVFSETMHRELSRCRRAGTPLAVVLIDVDHFKRVNDTWGHAGGDVVLQRLAVVIGDSIRPEDCACRWGGEEFVVALPGCGAEAARAKAELWRKSFEAVEIDWPEGPIRTTMSLGVAVFPAGGEDEASLLKACDAALYRSKSEGRNRTTLAA